MFENETQQVDQALASFRRKEQQLYREDGERIYSDEEHARRVEGLLQEFDQAKSQAEAEADRAVESANKTLQLEHRDPTDVLTAEELARANARRAFVAEDAEALPLSELTDRVRAATVAGDKATAFLYARYARRRVDSGLEAGRERGGLPARDAALLRTLGEALDELDGLLVDPEAEHKLSEARASLDAAQKLKLHAATQRREADGTAGFQRRQSTEHYRSTF